MLGKIKEYQGVHFLMSFESMLKRERFAGLEKENIRDAECTVSHFFFM